MISIVNFWLRFTFNSALSAILFLWRMRARPSARERAAFLITFLRFKISAEFFKRTIGIQIGQICADELMRLDRLSECSNARNTQLNRGCEGRNKRNTKWKTPSSLLEKNNNYQLPKHRPAAVQAEIQETGVSEWLLLMLHHRAFHFKTIIA